MQFKFSVSYTHTGDSKRVQHLLALEGAHERLHLFEADLLEEGSFDSVVDGCEGVFHTASPVFFKVVDPQVYYLNYFFLHIFTIEFFPKAESKSLSTHAELSRKIVVICISGSIYSKQYHQANVEYYALSKTLAEKTTWKFAEENGIDVVTLHPGYVIGPLLQPTLNFSSEALLDLIKEGKPLWPNGVYRYVDVRDVALAHVLAFENSSAQGRYLLVGSVTYSFEAIDILNRIFPTLSCPPTSTEDRPAKPPYRVSQEKAKSLGLDFMPLEVSLKDTVESFKQKNFLS
ncbi:NAD(P)-binding Rossmann-fold superfamily protein [Striga hermonthica]|uniref:NAD(P)-binding Rossmann-fold superfamily protein n=1 Tax=Striga hermonthica TaxID=68872 RepID=A0A9N7NMT1_STRHE|nr:NAD(P)-binding Rossmann-fold superfamily protein [Striga hermonthica]